MIVNINGSVKKSFSKINLKLYFSLLVMGLCPTLYMTFRVYLIGQIPNAWVYSIAGQLSWIGLIYEIINESIILPLYFFISKGKNNREELANKVKTGLLFSFIVYFALCIGIHVLIDTLLNIMAADKNILRESAEYIKIESVANIPTILCSFLFVCLISLGNIKSVYTLTFLQLTLYMIFDYICVSGHTFDFGINGIGYSSILVQSVLLVVCLLLLSKEMPLFKKRKLDCIWMKDLFRIGGISGIESFVRNIAYMVMISRMVNVAGEQGTYWVANSFIWGWLLLPINQLAELIKSEVSNNNKAIYENTKSYFLLTSIICFLWITSIPTWKFFLGKVLGFNEVDKLFNLVMILLIFYMFYAFQNVFDAEFYALGRTDYMLFESVVTNTIYYGTAFALYKLNIFKPTLLKIALLFGFGNVFDSMVSGLAYLHLRKHIDSSIPDSV